VSQVIVEVEDQDRALTFWTEIMEFELVQDAPYGEGGRWIEVRTRDKATILVLRPRQGDRPRVRDELPTSNTFFYCDDLPRTYDELRARRRVRPASNPAELGLVVDVRRPGGQPVRTRPARDSVIGSKRSARRASPG
jgi:catechol 2,3-dioxygenase-like lactoylglutathione lyase family enzyme